MNTLEQSQKILQRLEHESIYILLGLFSPDEWRCKYCLESSPDPDIIAHLDDCPLTLARDMVKYLESLPEHGAD